MKMHKTTNKLRNRANRTKKEMIITSYYISSRNKLIHGAFVLALKKIDFVLIFLRDFKLVRVLSPCFFEKIYFGKS